MPVPSIVRTSYSPTAGIWGAIFKILESAVRTSCTPSSSGANTFAFRISVSMVFLLLPALQLDSLAILYNPVFPSANNDIYKYI